MHPHPGDSVENRFKAGDEAGQLNLVDIMKGDQGKNSRHAQVAEAGDHVPELHVDDEAQSLKPGDHLQKLKVEGLEREYEIHIPKGYDGHSKLPVVYMLHGLTENREMMKEYSHMNDVSDKQGFAVVYLQALEQPLPGTVGLYDETSWNLDHGTLTPKDKRYDDLNYFQAVKGGLEENVNIDSDRMFLAGFSEGGQASQYILNKMPHTFAGMALVHSTLLESDPHPTKESAASTMVVLGDDDHVLPKEGGRGLVTLLIPKTGESQPLEQAPAWAAANGNKYVRKTGDAQQEVTEYSGGLAVVKEVVRKSDCELIIIDCHGGKHAWDGGNGGWKHAKNDLITMVSKPVRVPDPRYDTSSEIWKFFKDKKRVGAD